MLVEQLKQELGGDFDILEPRQAKEGSLTDFTAESSKVTKRLDLSELKNGDYNLVLIDIQGRESKTNVIIKK